MMNEVTVHSLAVMGFVILVLALIVVVIIGLIKVWQTKIKTSQEEVYQRLAQDAITAQEDTARLNEKLVTELSEMKERIISIERMLKEVE